MKHYYICPMVHTVITLLEDPELIGNVIQPSEYYSFICARDSFLVTILTVLDSWTPGAERNHS